jgi:hypothetical protein
VTDEDPRSTPDTRPVDPLLQLEARRETIRQLREMDGLDLDQPDVMLSAWRRRPADSKDG